MEEKKRKSVGFSGEERRRREVDGCVDGGGEVRKSVKRKVRRSCASLEGEGKKERGCWVGQEEEEAVCEEEGEEVSCFL